MSQASNIRSWTPDDVLAEPTLTDGEARSVLRRQLIGSAVAAMVVILFAGFTAIRSGHETSSEAAGRRLAVVQQPSFVAPAGRLVALKRPLSAPATQSEQH
ncbi:MAG TPA: hypothetical protein VKV96_10795 [Roseiarcus sp.]|nr:hypothetical protein [Roseiarcus sp.]